LLAIFGNLIVNDFDFQAEVYFARIFLKLRE